MEGAAIPLCIEIASPSSRFSQGHASSWVAMILFVEGAPYKEPPAIST